MRWPCLRNRLLELFQDRRILQGGYVLRNLLAFGDGAQQPAHDFPRARLGQVIAEADVLGFGDRADLLADPIAQFLRNFLRLCAGRAHTASPVMSSGRPTTAASATSAVFATSADSISIVPRRWPDTFSTSSMRPMMRK